MASPAVSLVSSMLTPALLITGSGSLIGACAARYGRIFDRARHLIENLHSDALRAGLSRETAIGWLERYEKRILYIERALIGLFVGVAFFVADSLLIALEQSFNILHWLPVVGALFGSFSLLVGVAFMIAESILGGHQIHDEVSRARAELLAQTLDPKAK